VWTLVSRLEGKSVGRRFLGVAREKMWAGFQKRLLNDNLMTETLQF
jgi:hypothetical protein